MRASRDPAPEPGPLSGRLAPAAVYPAGPCGDDRIGVRFVTVRGGLRVRALVCGEGPDVVLLHGWGASAFTFRRAVLPLADAGYRVTLVEVPGHGLSDKPLEREHYALPRLADAVLEALAHLGVERFAVCGHSMGGGIALHLALTERERITHLALLGAARVGSVRGIAMLQALALGLAVPLYPYLITRFGIRWLLGAVYGRGQPFSARDVDEYWAPSQWPSYARAMWCIVKEYDWSLVEPEDVRGLAIPTLVMTAARDWVVSPREAAAYARAIPGATLEVVPGAGHLFPEAQSDRTNAALLALLARPDAPASR